jgi:hypothetical protein
MLRSRLEYLARAYGAGFFFCSRVRFAGVS